MSRSGPQSMHFNVPNQRSGAHTCSGKHSPTTPIHACSSCTLLSAHRRSTTCGKMNQSSFWFRCCAKKSWTSALCSGKHGATTTARAYLLCTLVSAFQTVFIMVVNINGVQLVPCGILRDHQSSLPTGIQGRMLLWWNGDLFICICQVCLGQLCTSFHQSNCITDGPHFEVGCKQVLGQLSVIHQKVVPFAVPFGYCKCL